jgi:hypothetical protein
VKNQALDNRQPLAIYRRRRQIQKEHCGKEGKTKKKMARFDFSPAISLASRCARSERDALQVCHTYSDLSTFGETYVYKEFRFELEEIVFIERSQKT